MSVAKRLSNRGTALAILVVALFLAGIVSFYAAATPDGLTKVSEDEGFASSEKEHATGEGPFAGYGSSFISNERLSGGVAGVVGVVVVLALGSGLALVVRRRRDPADSSDSTAESQSSSV